MGQVDQWGKTHVRTRLLCTFPIFAIRRAIPDPGCYQNLALLPEPSVLSTEKIYSLSWKWCAVARICSWLLWCQCCYSTSAASQKVSISFSADTGGRTVFILLETLSSPGGLQGKGACKKVLRSDGSCHSLVSEEGTVTAADHAFFFFPADIWGVWVLRDPQAPQQG